MGLLYNLIIFQFEENLQSNNLFWESTKHKKPIICNTYTFTLS